MKKIIQSAALFLLLGGNFAFAGNLPANCTVSVKTEMQYLPYDDEVNWPVDFSQCEKEFVLGYGPNYTGLGNILSECTVTINNSIKAKLYYSFGVWTGYNNSDLALSMKQYQSGYSVRMLDERNDGAKAVAEIRLSAQNLDPISFSQDPAPPRGGSEEKSYYQFYFTTTFSDNGCH